MSRRQRPLRWKFSRRGPYASSPCAIPIPNPWSSRMMYLAQREYLVSTRADYYYAASGKLNQEIKIFPASAAHDNAGPADGFPLRGLRRILKLRDRQLHLDVLQFADAATYYGTRS